MTYYVLLPNDSEEDALILGEESMGSFYMEQGFVALNNIINDHPELVDKVSIFTENNKKLTITEFFDILANLSIKYNF